MAKVYDVDPRVIAAHATWLAAQQQADGSWKPDTNFINEGATNRYNSDAAAHRGVHRVVARKHGLSGSGGGEGEELRGIAIG